jgi:hypothetical protein
MFDHYKHVQHWTTMGCYVCDPLYYQILAIAICNMQSKDVDSQMLMWNSLHAFINGWCNLTKNLLIFIMWQWWLHWLPTIKSQESTRSRCVQVECNTPLESSRGELQVCFKPCSNQRLEQEVMNAQSLGSLNRDSFGTPLWESWEKVPFECKCGDETQRILCEGRWWLLPSLGCGESSESKVARGLF